MSDDEFEGGAVLNRPAFPSLERYYQRIKVAHYATSGQLTRFIILLAGVSSVMQSAATCQGGAQCFTA